MSANFKSTLLVLALGSVSIVAHADNTELEIYRGDIADEGESNVDFSANVIRSSKQSEQKGVTAFQAVGEYSYGIDDNWEIGAKLPVSAENGVWKIDGLLAEVKYVGPHAKTGWYWGAEIELGYESSVFEPQRWTTEAVPILGWKNGIWDVAVNPGMSIASAGNTRGTVVFEPAAKISHAMGSKSAIGLEYFSEAGPLSNILPSRERNELGFLTIDTRVGKGTINLGVGRGLNGTSPGVALKTVIDLEFD